MTYIVSSGALNSLIH